MCNKIDISSQTNRFAVCYEFRIFNNQITIFSSSNSIHKVSLIACSDIGHQEGNSIKFLVLKSILIRMHEYSGSY